MPSFRSSISTGILVGLASVVLAHLYRATYLLAGGTGFAEINVVSTTLAAFIPTFLVALAFGLLRRRVAWARPAFTIGVLALAIVSAVPFFLAPPHPGFALLAAPLHVIVGATAAFGIPWRASQDARASERSEVSELRSIQ